MKQYPTVHNSFLILADSAGSIQKLGCILTAYIIEAKPDFFPGYLRFNMNRQFKRYFFLAGGIICSASSKAYAQNIDHSLGPIKQAQAADPAGFTLMIVCIGLLVFMVLGLFGGTMFYMCKDKSKNKQYSGSSPQKEESKIGSE